MSRRHKTPEELERIQSRQRGSRGDSSLNATSSHNGSASDLFMNTVVTKRVSRRFSISTELITRALSRAFIGIEDATLDKFSTFLTGFTSDMNLPPDVTHSIMQSAIAEYKRMSQEEEEKTGNRGKCTVERLLGGYENEEVCSWYDRIARKFKKFISSTKQLLCCLFCAIFDIVPTESPHQKETCYYRMMKDHIGEKIPSMSTIQKGIKWFWGWRKEVIAWRNKAREEREHSIWERLYRLIMGELPQLQPRLGMC